MSAFRFPETACSAIIGDEFGSHMGNVGLSLCFDVGELRIASRRYDRAEALVRRHNTARGSAIRACQSVEEAISGADVVLSVTSAREPVPSASRLEPGATVVGLGGDHEIDASVLDWASLFVVDDLEYACIAGSVAAWLRTGRVDRATVERRLAGTIGDAALGRVARSSAGQRILAVVQGMAICDLALANTALARGRA